MLFWPKGSGCCCAGECGTIRAVVRVCPDSIPVASATVTVRDADGATVGTCTTDATGICEVPIPAAGDYTVTAAKAGQVTTTVSASATCTTNDVIVELGRVIQVTVRGCAVTPTPNTIAGAVVTATLGGSTYTGTTDASGNLSLPVQANGTYTITATESTGRLAYSANVVISCGTTSHLILMVAAAGYHCINWTTTWGCVRYPIADTLFMTDSVHGACTLTWSDAAGGWAGSISATTPACSKGEWDCPEQEGVEIRYLLNPTSSLNTTFGGGRNALFPGYDVDADGCATNPGPGTSPTSIQVRITAVTCPPAAFSSTHHYDDLSPVFDTPSPIYCLTGPTLTVTE